jgi:hypothetical protein
VFVDIDGVLSITNAGNQHSEIDQKDAWPIPQAAYFIRQLATDPRYYPVWMTHWGQKAQQWNELAETAPWPVAFPLSKAAEAEAEQLFPLLARKQLAIAYYMQQHSIQRAVWIQDGFAPETKTWAASQHVALIDTNSEPYHSWLLSHDEHEIHRFISTVFEDFYERV